MVLEWWRAHATPPSDLPKAAPGRPFFEPWSAETGAAVADVAPLPRLPIFALEIGLNGCSGQLLDVHASTCSRHVPLPLPGS
jgi:hypothetical protein